MRDSKDLNVRNNRVQWIDCTKTIAIIAVLVDHCNGILYDNQYIAQTSYFSVSLFVLLSGMTSYMSSSKNGLNWKRQLKRIGKLFLQYALAVFIVLIALVHYFDLNTYLQYVVSFNIQAPYYFLVFYIQLLLLTPLLIRWCEFCDSRKYNYIWHIATLLLLIWLSSVFIRYTYILPVHGGGQYLAGGTYIILFYLGILFIKIDLFNKCIRKFRKAVLGGALLLCVLWVYGRMRSLFRLDAGLAPWFGGGFNPPGFEIMLFSLLVLLALYCIFSLVEERKSKLAGTAIKLFSRGGKNTLHIFMYHLLVRDKIMANAPTILLNNIWLRRVIVFIPMLVFPALIVEIFLGITKYIKSTMNQNI